MNNSEFEKIERISNKTLDTIEKMIDELEIAECERKIYKNLIKAMIRTERLDAAIIMQEYYMKERYNS